MSKRAHTQPQLTISSYFNSSQRSLRTNSASAPIEIDLTSDDEPPSKKVKVARQPSKQPESPHTGLASQWRFTPISQDKPVEPELRQRTEAVAANERREAFKRKLLLENKRSSRKTTETELEVEAQETDRESEDSDRAFRELSFMFSNKGNRKNKASNPSKHIAPSAVGPSGQAYTPLEKQVLQLKKEHTGTVLMIEVGYKYKFFGDDAKIAAKELGMVAFNDRNFLVASIPIHRRDVHMKNLLSRGYRVGIVNQIETAALKKISENRNAPFDRKLVHLYTAATYVDSLDSVDDVEKHSPPPFLCLVEESKTANSGDVSLGLITICPSTGDVVWDDFDDTLMRIELETRLIHTRPSELLLPKDGLSHPTAKMLQHFTGISSTGHKIRTELFNTVMSYADAFQLVSDFYTDKTRAVAASENFKSGRLIAEVADFPKRVIVALAHAIKHLSDFSIADAFMETRFFSKFTTKAHMLLAGNTLTNLEIYRNDTDHTTKGSLLWVLDRTKTKFGARLLRSWIGRPLVDKRVLQDRVDAVEEILASSSEKLVTLRQILQKLPDLAKGLSRIQYGQCTPQELAILLRSFNKIATAFETAETPSDVGFQSSLINEIIFSLPKLKEPLHKILGAVSLKHATEGNKASMWTDPGLYPAIGDAEMAIQHVEVELEEQLKAIRKLLKMPSLKWSTVAGDEFLVEVKRSENRPIPDSWPLHSKTKYFARYQPSLVKQTLDERAQYQETLEAEANKAFSSFLQDIALNHYNVMRDAVNKLAVADCLLSLALVALQDNYVRPTFNDDDTLEIVDGRHPMVEALRPDPFVPNTVIMGGKKPRSKIITGPNMGGKSSCVRMIALIAIMAQIGSYVPATSVKLGLLDSVLTRMGASDDLARGRSTFMVEMSETSEILHSASKNSLVILDELGRGTSTFDGMAIADAVMQQLLETTECKALFITHYPLVASHLEKRYPLQVENLHMGYEEETRIDGTREIIFLYKLAPGMASGSFGIECGRLAGLPDGLLTIASESSSKLQIHVRHRAKRNRLHKSTNLIAKCLASHESAIAGIRELRSVAKSVFDVTEI